MNRKVFILSIAILAVMSLAASAEQKTIARVDSFITTGIASSGDILLFGDSVGNFYAAGGASWTYHDSDASAIGIPAVQGDKVVFAQAEGTLTCLNISDGSRVWSRTPAFDESATEGLNDGPAIGGECVYAAFTSGNLRAFRLSDGHRVWRYKAKQGLRTAPLYYDGLVLLGEYDGLFSMIDAETGERINGGGAGGALNTPSVNDGNVYYSAWDGSVHAVQIKAVIPLWDAKAGEPVTTSPVIGEGLVVVGTASGKIIAFEEKTGTKLWEHDTNGGQILALPVINGDRVLAGTGDGKVIELSSKTGKLIREHSQSASYSLSSAEGNTFYYVNDKQELCAIN